MNILNKINKINSDLCFEIVYLQDGKAICEKKDKMPLFDKIYANEYLFKGTKYDGFIVYDYCNDGFGISVSINNESLCQIYNEIGYYIFEDICFWEKICEIIKDVYKVKINSDDFDAIITVVREIFNELVVLIRCDKKESHYNNVLVPYIQSFYYKPEKEAKSLNKYMLNYGFTSTGQYWEGYDKFEYGEIKRNGCIYKGLKLRNKDFLFKDIFDVLKNEEVLDFLEYKIFDIDRKTLLMIFDLSKDIFEEL